MAVPAQAEAKEVGCKQTFTQRDHKHYATAALSKPRVTRRTLHRIYTIRRCQRTPGGRRLALNRTRGLRRAYKTRKVRVSAVGGLEVILAKIRNCESHGVYTTDTGNGFYGAYQFTLGTWAGVGGTGNPAQASPAEQDMRAAILYRRSGPGQWPVCGA